LLGEEQFITNSKVLHHLKRSKECIDIAVTVHVHIGKSSKILKGFALFQRVQLCSYCIVIVSSSVLKYRK